MEGRVLQNGVEDRGAPELRAALAESPITPRLYLNSKNALTTSVFWLANERAWMRLAGE